MVWQIEWFGNEAGTTIGTLAVGKANQGWDYAVLGRDKSGDFHVYKLGRDAFSLDDARVEFLLEMADAEKSLAGESENEKRASPNLANGRQTNRPEMSCLFGSQFMKPLISYPCKKCHLPTIYLITFRRLVKTHPPTYKFSVECACKPGKMYATEEEAIQAFNKANAPEKKKAYR